MVKLVTLEMFYVNCVIIWVLVVVIEFGFISTVVVNDIENEFYDFGS